MRDKILAMEPGRELDALVAEKVMGWDRDSMGCMGAPEGTKEHNIQRTMWVTAWDENGIPTFLPKYSTNISAAWEIIEKIKEHYWIALECSNHWFQTRIGNWASTGKTAPEAICKTALLAVTHDT